MMKMIQDVNKGDVVREDGWPDRTVQFVSKSRLIDAAWYIHFGSTGLGAREGTYVRVVA